jgi:hypothetical protein
VIHDFYFYLTPTNFWFAVLLYSFIMGRLCEHVTVTDGRRLCNLYEHVNTQQLISDALASPIRM